ncbi:hypothetical protein XAB3213_3880015 [Xanthomonas citri pv. bilvae]|nr:hypothetical protein XAB3213_3880015 [Xanthomonas citri pv. bilvae]
MRYSGSGSSALIQQTSQGKGPSHATHAPDVMSRVMMLTAATPESRAASHFFRHSPTVCREFTERVVTLQSLFCGVAPIDHVSAIGGNPNTSRR